MQTRRSRTLGLQRVLVQSRQLGGHSLAQRPLLLAQRVRCAPCRICSGSCAGPLRGLAALCCGPGCGGSGHRARRCGVLRGGGKLAAHGGVQSLPQCCPSPQRPLQHRIVATCFAALDAMTEEHPTRWKCRSSKPAVMPSQVRGERCDAHCADCARGLPGPAHDDVASVPLEIPPERSRQGHHCHHLHHHHHHPE